MKLNKDIQTFIPETHQDLIEAVPRGFPNSAVTASVLLGAIFGSLWTYLLPTWLAATFLVVLVIVHLLYKYRSDKVFDKRIAELKKRGLQWKTK